MRKIIVATVCVIFALALSVTAAEGKKKAKWTDEQKSVHKQMLEKYDANKDGKLGKDEKVKMSGEDKKAMAQAFKKDKEEGKKPEKKEKKDKKTK